MQSSTSQPSRGNVPLLEENEALSRILERVSPLPVSAESLSTALGLRCGCSMHATQPLPGFDNSSMDGYAVRAADTASSSPLAVIGEQPAGPARPLTLLPHSAIRIFTGAPIPAGSDAVIMQEDVIREGDTIRCLEPVDPGENIRPVGADLCSGQKILSQGELLTPARLAVLASQGLVEVPVIPSPRIAVVTTGDELVQPGNPLQPGQIYSTNQHLLRGMIQQTGPCQITTRHLPDHLPQTIDALRQLCATHHFVIVSGGVSVGDHDHVKPALQALGITPELWRVRVKPGKPLLYARTDTTHIFGLPGNPVSTFVTFHLFVRPAILKALGAEDVRPPGTKAVLTGPVSNPGDRPHYVRGHLAGHAFTPSHLQQSHALFALSQTNALLRLDPMENLAAGASVSVLTF